MKTAGVLVLVPLLMASTQVLAAGEGPGSGIWSRCSLGRVGLISAALIFGVQGFLLSTP